MAKTVPIRAVDNDVTERWKLPTGARVIVVDDDTAMREQIATRLQHEGYRIYSVMSGLELVRILDTRSQPDGARGFADVDLFILDRRIESTNGLDVLRRLRFAAPLPCIILITAAPDGEIVREAARLRVEVLTRPFSLDHLADAVTLTLLSRFAQR